MKKKSLKSLALNKKTISSFDREPITGGLGLLTEADVRVCNKSIIDGSICQSQGGCTGGPDETITCAAWSCTCPQR